MTTEFRTDIAKDTMIAVPIRWEGTASGCVEWQLVGWTTPEDSGQRLPVVFDGGEKSVWASDYARRAPQDDSWAFPDGERSGNAGLVAAFMRRAGTTLNEYKPTRAERRALARRLRQVKETEQALEALEARGEVRSVVNAYGEKRWIAVSARH